MQYPADEETVLVLLERVNEAQRLAARELREIQSQDPRKKKRKRGADGGDGDGGDGGDDDGDNGDADTTVKNVMKRGGGKAKKQKGKH
jgi:hypothetical protein